MSETAQKSAIASGSHAPVTAQKVPDVDPENPPDEFTDALEADDFIIFGKASIEKFDSGGENSDTPEILDLSPDAIESALERFFESEKAPGIISIGHDDIPVGKPLREYEVGEDTALEVGGDTYDFEAGETLTTHVEDADGDDRPELWMLGNIANDSRIARKARLGILTGELDGYSVTFGRHAESVEREGIGQRVGSYDLHSVTLAPEDMVANEGSEFDLAAFKAQFADYQATDDATHGLTAVAEALDSAIHVTMNEQEDKKGLFKGLSDFFGQKAEEVDETDESDADDGTDADAGQKEDGMNGGGDDDGASVEDLVRALAEKLGEDPEDLMNALSQNADDGDDDEGDEEDEDDDAGMKSGDDANESELPDGVLTEDDIGEKLSEHGVVTEDDLESFRESVVDDLGQKLTDANQEAVEEIAQKMDTGETPTPAGGSFQDSEDFDSHLEDISGGEGW